MVCDDCYWLFYLSDSKYYAICMIDDTNMERPMPFCPYHITHDQVEKFIKEEYIRRGLF